MPAIVEINVLQEIKQLQDEMVSWRRDLHANPELGFAESRTSTFIQERLQSFAVDEIHVFTGTGVIAVIHGRGDGDHTSSREGMDLVDRERSQAFLNKSTCAGLGKSQFGIGMQISAPAHHLIL